MTPIHDSQNLTLQSLSGPEIEQVPDQSVASMKNLDSGEKQCITQLVLGKISGNLPQGDKSQDSLSVGPRGVAEKFIKRLNVSPKEERDFLTKDFPLSHYDCAIWECIEVKKGKNGGKILVYKMKKCFDPKQNPENPEKAQLQFVKKNKEIYPAIEPSSAEVLKIYNRTSSNVKESARQLVEASIETLINCRIKIQESKLTDIEGEAENLWLHALLYESYVFVDKKVLKNFMHLPLSMEIEQFKLKAQEQVIPFIKALKTNLSFKEYVKKEQIVPQLLNNLGFSTRRSEEGYVIFEIPDREALEASWLHFTDSYGLPNIRFETSEGIASDMEFVDKILIGGLVMSNGRESLHDAYVHVTRTILLILSHTDLSSRASKYLQERQKMTDIIRPAFDKIRLVRQHFQEESFTFNLRDLEKIEASLGMRVDIWTSASVYGDGSVHGTGKYSRSAIKDLLDVWDSLPNKEYFVKRFGEEPNIKRLEEIWLEIQDFLPKKPF